MKKNLPWIVLCLLSIGAWWAMGSNEISSTAVQTKKQPVQLKVVPMPAADLPRDHSQVLERSEPKYEIPLEDDENAPKFFTLLALQSETETPLASLEVLWVETPWKQFIKEEEWDEVLEKTGTVGRLDSKGEIRLPWNENNVDFLVRGDGYYARGRRSPKNDRKVYKLEMALEQTVEVKVNHHDGTPAEGFLVSYLWIYAPERSTSKVGIRTNSEGIARLEHMQVHSAYAKPDVIHSILVGLPAKTAVQFSFPLAEGPPQKVELTLPPLGYLDITARLADGSPVEDGSLLIVQKKGSWRLRTDHLLGFDLHPIRNGQARVPVGLNLEIDAFIMSGDFRTPPVRGRSKGPTLPGESLPMLLQQTEAPCYVVGKLWMPNGKPLTNTSLRGRLIETGGSGGFRISTDAEGVFRMPIEDRHLENADLDEERAPFRLATFSYLHEGGGRVWCGRMDLSRTLEPGDNDMGDIHLGPDLMLSGVVVDQSGNYLNGVSLELEGASSSKTSWDGNAMMVPIGHGLFKNQSNGRFQVFATDPVTSLVLKVKKEGYLPASFDLDPGSTDQTFSLKSGGGLELRILTDPEVDISSVVGVMKSGLADQEWHSSFGFYGERGIANSVVKGLEPGNYTLVLSTNTLREEILTIENIVVGDDAKPDPRLDPVDLRGKLFARKIIVTSPDGTKPDLFFLAPPDSFSRGIRLPNQTTVLTPFEDWMVELWSDSQAMLVHITEPQTEITLESAYWLHVVLDSPPSRLEGSQLEVSLRLESEGDRFFYRSYELNFGEPLKVPLQFPGNYILQFRENFAPDSGRKLGSQHLMYEEAFQIPLKVHDATHPQVIRIEGRDLHQQKQQ